MKTQSITLDDLTFGEAMAFKAIAQELKLAKEKHPKWIKGLPNMVMIGQSQLIYGQTLTGYQNRFAITVI